MLSDAKYELIHEKRRPLDFLTPTQTYQRLPIAHAQVKVGNTSENKLNETNQIIYSLYRAKEITKKLYNNMSKV